jgi:exodeoxyribonuclease-1
MGFVIYDLETTGLKKRFDQILQFAAVRTDANLEVQEQVEFEGRLRPHILPSPGALHVTGGHYANLIDPFRPSYDAMLGEIYGTMKRWTPSMFIGFNSISYDEEVLRQAFYESLRAPIYVTNRDGNSRGDLLKLARVVGTLQPDVLKTTRGPDGRRVFRLADLAQANGIHPGKSHTASADVATTLALCRLIAAEAPILWSSFMRFSNKAEVLSFIAERDAFAVFEFKRGVQDVHPVTAIGFKPADKNVRYCLDLTADLAALRRMSPDELVIEIGKPDGPILRMKANGSPILAELWELDQALLGDFTEADLETTAANVRGDAAFVQRLITAAIDSERVWPKSKYVEFQIYDGFIQDWDEDVCRRFHAAAWKDRPALIDRFQDPRLKKLARRLIYFERPDLLDAEMRGQIDRAIWGRLQGSEPDAPGRSYAATLLEFDALVAEVQVVSPSLASYRDHLQAQLVAVA